MGMKDRGQGQTSPSTMDVKTAKATQPLPNPRTDGEVPGAGSVYTATLNERENKSNTRNRGPDRGTGGVVGDAKLPVVNTGSRRTGRVG